MERIVGEIIDAIISVEKETDGLPCSIKFGYDLHMSLKAATVPSSEDKFYGINAEVDHSLSEREYQLCDAVGNVLKKGLVL